MVNSNRTVDVLVVGAGPVGLITAYQLARFGGVSVAIIEKHAKSMQNAYGRAITLYPRTSEMLDQLGLAEDLVQQCFACRETVTYNAAGQEVKGRGWNFMEQMTDTAFDFALVLRQKYQEEIFREALSSHGVQVEAPVELLNVDVNDATPLLGHKVTATVRDASTQTQSTITCKYLIGCDGGRSSVRKLMGIAFEGATTEDRWVRVDGLVKTNVPKPRTYCSIESPTHGNVLWVGLDHGATRVGYAFTADRAKAYEVFDEAAAVKEAIAAVQPFSLEFERVDWWTIYSVGQRIAENFFVKDCVFLAGDACHTHSSGAAQGMNTGIHDATNLSWKLSLVLRNIAKPEILNTYQAERLPNVKKLIQYDKDISRLMTNRWPENWSGDADADVGEVLGKIMSEAGTFSSGLGIFYELTGSNDLSFQGSYACPDGLLSVGPGRRAPDVPLLYPGTLKETRLLSVTPNVAKFYILIFAGDPESTNEQSFFDAVRASRYLGLLLSRGLIEFITLLHSQASSAYEVLGHDPLGRVYFDTLDRKAYKRYAIDDKEGAVVAVRPDGWIACMCRLRIEAHVELQEYFQRIYH